jgi:hypothetical protein
MYKYEHEHAGVYVGVIHERGWWDLHAEIGTVDFLIWEQ